MDTTVFTNILFGTISVFFIFITIGFTVLIVFAISILKNINSFLNDIANMKSRISKIIKIFKRHEK